MRGGVALTDNLTERSFKALPSRQFGTAPPIDWQQSTGLQIIEASTSAREVIPQPKLQPNLSKETRRRWQFALLSRAPRKPFSQLSKSHFIQLSKWSDESKPHSVLAIENCMTLTFQDDNSESRTLKARIFTCASITLLL